MTQSSGRKAFKLSCSHADTCLPDFWGGHHLAHISVEVTPATTMNQLRRALHAELDQDAVAGNEPLTRDDSGDDGDLWYKAAHSAIERDVKLKRGERVPFGHLPKAEDEDSQVRAYFVFDFLSDYRKE